MNDQSKRIFLRSQEWFDDPEHADMTALYVERYMNYGLTRDELQSGRPIIGIAQTGSDGSANYSQVNSTGDASKDYQLNKTIEELQAQKFTDLADISDFVVVYHGIPREIATQVINGALSASSNPEVRIEVAIQLFGKIYEKFGK